MMMAQHMRQTAAGGMAAETLAFLARFSVQPSAAIASAYDRFIKSAVQSGAWARLDAIWMFSAPDAQSSLLCLNNAAYNAAAVLVPAFSATFGGYTGDGIASYIDSNYQPSGGAKIYQLNDAEFGLFSRTTGTNNNTAMGARSGLLTMYGTPRNAADNMLGRINDTTASGIPGVTDGSGLFSWSRPDSATKEMWRNGVQVGTDLAIASTSLPGAGNLWFCAANGSTFSNIQISGGYVGGCLTAAQRLTLAAAWQQYLTDVGAV